LRRISHHSERRQAASFGGESLNRPIATGFGRDRTGLDGGYASRHMFMVCFVSFGVAQCPVPSFFAAPLDTWSPLGVGCIARIVEPAGAVRRRRITDNTIA